MRPWRGGHKVLVACNEKVVADRDAQGCRVGRLGSNTDGREMGVVVNVRFTSLTKTERPVVDSPSAHDQGRRGRYLLFQKVLHGLLSLLGCAGSAFSWWIVPREASSPSYLIDRQQVFH